MSTQSAEFDRVAQSDSNFESWARSLCEFVVRAVLLPFTLFLTKPSALLRAASSGEYRPLPSPFLLALIVGLVVYGVLQTLFAPDDQITDFAGFVTELFGFFNGELTNIGILLYPLPYIFILWGIAGAISLLMLRGIRTAEVLVTSISLCLSALIEVTIALSAIGFGLSFISAPVMMGLAIGLFVYGLIIAVKMVRILFLLRKERHSPLAGVILGAIPTFLIVALIGLLGAALSFGVYQERDALHQSAIADATQRAHELADRGQHEQAVAAYTRAIDLKANDPVVPEDAYLYNSRCWSRAVWGQDPQVLYDALADCNYALQLMPDTPFILDSRGLVNLRLGEYQAAYDDYNAAVTAEPGFAHALYGRGLAQLRLGNAEAGDKDKADAVQFDPQVANRFYEYGINPDGTDRQQAPVAERSDPQEQLRVDELRQQVERLRTERAAAIAASRSSQLRPADPAPAPTTTP